MSVSCFLLGALEVGGQPGQTVRKLCTCLIDLTLRERHRTRNKAWKNPIRSIGVISLADAMTILVLTLTIYHDPSVERAPASTSRALGAHIAHMLCISR